jgi:hypothetical protein
MKPALSESFVSPHSYSVTTNPGQSFFQLFVQGMNELIQGVIDAARTAA